MRIKVQFSKQLDKYCRKSKEGMLETDPVFVDMESLLTSKREE